MQFAERHPAYDRKSIPSSSLPSVDAIPRSLHAFRHSVTEMPFCLATLDLTGHWTTSHCASQCLLTHPRPFPDPPSFTSSSSSSSSPFPLDLCSCPSLPFPTIQANHPCAPDMDAQERMSARHGNQAGDPVKGAKAMYELAIMKDPPLRCVIGTDAVSIHPFLPIPFHFPPPVRKTRAVSNTLTTLLTPYLINIHIVRRDNEQDRKIRAELQEIRNTKQLDRCRRLCEQSIIS